jgi:hypothetical protein
MAFNLGFEEGLIVLRFHDALTPDDVRAFTQQMLSVEAALEPTPDRLIDFSGVTLVKIGYPEISEIVRARQAHPPKNPIRSAVVGPTDIDFGTARMFQLLNNHPLVHVEVFRDLPSAFVWLKSPPTRP